MRAIKAEKAAGWNTGDLRSNDLAWQQIGSDDTLPRLQVQRIAERHRVTAAHAGVIAAHAFREGRA